MVTAIREAMETTTMKHARRWVLILILAIWLPTTLALAGDANLFLGKREISDDLLDEAGIGGQTQYGAQVTLGSDWPVGFAVDLFFSSDDSSIALPAGYPLEYSTDVSTVELDLGVRKIWREKLRPYVGGGLAWVRLEAKQTVYREFVPGEGQYDTLRDCGWPSGSSD